MNAKRLGSESNRDEKRLKSNASVPDGSKPGLTLSTRPRLVMSSDAPTRSTTASAIWPPTRIDRASVARLSLELMRWRSQTIARVEARHAGASAKSSAATSARPSA